MPDTPAPVGQARYSLDGVHLVLHTDAGLVVAGTLYPHANRALVLARAELALHTAYHGTISEAMDAQADLCATPGYRCSTEGPF